MKFFEPQKSNHKVKPNGAYTSGVYGLVDPLFGDIRYVGSSIKIERRVYAHHHNKSVSKRLLCQRWIDQMQLAGLVVRAQLLELVPEEQLSDRRFRNDIERKWVEHFHTIGQADLNVQLTPVGHPNGSDGPLARMRKHIYYLENLLTKSGVAFNPDSRKNY